MALTTNLGDYTGIQGQLQKILGAIWPYDKSPLDPFIPSQQELKQDIQGIRNPGPESLQLPFAPGIDIGKLIRAIPGLADMLMSSDATMGMLNPLSIRVFHGGAGKIRPEPGFPTGRFKDEGVGTGQGARSFGWGHYNTTGIPVAEDYVRESPEVLFGGNTGFSSTRVRHEITGLAKELQRAAAIANDKSRANYIQKQVAKTLQTLERDSAEAGDAVDRWTKRLYEFEKNPRTHLNLEWRATKESGVYDVYNKKTGKLVEEGTRQGPPWTADMIKDRLWESTADKTSMDRAIELLKKGEYPEYRYGGGLYESILDKELEYMPWYTPVGKEIQEKVSKKAQEMAVRPGPERATFKLMQDQDAQGRTWYSIVDENTAQIVSEFQNPHEAEQVLETYRQMAADYPKYKSIEYMTRGTAEERGALLNEQERLLEMRRRLSSLIQQPEYQSAAKIKPKDALKTIVDQPLTLSEQLYHLAIPDELNRVQAYLDNYEKFDAELGKNLYHRLSSVLEGDKEASKFLESAGVPGIVYPAGTLGKGKHAQDFMNYVTFNPEDLTILENLWNNPEELLRLKRELSNK